MRALASSANYCVLWSLRLGETINAICDGSLLAEEAVIIDLPIDLPILVRREILSNGGKWCFHSPKAHSSFPDRVS